MSLECKRDSLLHLLYVEKGRIQVDLQLKMNVI